MPSKPFGLLCPTDPSHGTLIPLTEATQRGEGWYCPDQDHDGWKEQPFRRPFFTTADAEDATAAAKAKRSA
jgi:hypothetical protein